MLCTMIDCLEIVMSWLWGMLPMCLWSTQLSVVIFILSQTKNHCFVLLYRKGLQSTIHNTHIMHILALKTHCHIPMLMSMTFFCHCVCVPPSSRTLNVANIQFYHGEHFRARGCIIRRVSVSRLREMYMLIFQWSILVTTKKSYFVAGVNDDF